MYIYIVSSDAVDKGTRTPLGFRVPGAFDISSHYNNKLTRGAFALIVRAGRCGYMRVYAIEYMLQ